MKLSAKYVLVGSFLFLTPLLSHAASVSTSTPSTASTTPVSLPTYTVTIDAYVDGQPATTASAEGQTFPMNAWWDAKDIGLGKGDYGLGPTGYNSANPYEAVTAPMTQGGSYNTRETLSWNPNPGAVSGSCRAGDPFVFEGYSVGTSEAAAAAAPILATTTWPRFTNLTQNEYVIVWNRHCLTAPQPVSPKLGATVTSANLTQLSWTPITDPTGSAVTYYYEASNNWQTNEDGSFVTPVYKSSALSTASIVAGGTPVGVYYWHVKAVDAAGDSSAWGPAFVVKVPS